MIVSFFRIKVFWYRSTFGVQLAPIAQRVMFDVCKPGFFSVFIELKEKNLPLKLLKGAFLTKPQRFRDSFSANSAQSGYWTEKPQF